MDDNSPIGSTSSDQPATEPETPKAEEIPGFALAIAETQPESATLQKSRKGGKRQGAGRKALKVTDEDRRQVQELLEVGLRREDVARVVCGGISVDSLARHFGDILASAKIQAIRRVGQGLLRDAIDGDQTARIFYLKTQGGWRESGRVEVSGVDGAPIAYAAVQWRIVDPPQQ